MSNTFLGEIRIFGCNFAPRGWMFCDGQLLPVRAYAALFSVIGTNFGGNGTTTFGLPNLQGAAAMHWGQGPALTYRSLGETLGSPTVGLNATNLPMHNHPIVAGKATTGSVATATPTATTYLSNSLPDQLYITGTAQPNTFFSLKMIGQNGQSVPHENMQPYQTLNFCIAIDGIFPSRN